MAKAASIILLAFLLHCAYGQTLVRFCNVGVDEQAFCTAKVAPILSNATQGLQFSCISANSSENCIENIAQGVADIRMFDSGQLYKAYTQYNLTFLINEDYGNGLGAEYYSVAVVSSQLCGQSTTLASLKGRKACSTGYQRGAGWLYPMAALLESQAAQTVALQPNVRNDAETMSAFFSQGLCAPGAANDGPVRTPDGKGAAWDPLCSACKTRTSCSAEDDYAGYDGAMQCLEVGAGDVAFVKHTTPLDYASDGNSPQPWSTMRKADMRLVCSGLNGQRQGCAPVEEFATCNLGLVPAHAMAARPNWAQAAAVQAALVAAAQLPAFRDAVLNTTSNPSDWVFKSSSKNLTKITVSPSAFLGNSMTSFAQIQALDNTADSAPLARICTTSAAEQTFCASKVASLLNNASLGLNFTCVQKASDTECITAIANNLVDWRTFDSTDMYMAYADHELSFAVAEDYDGTGAGLEYFSVAVVKRSMCNSGTTLASLKGKNSCSTGYLRSAGWTFPVGTLIASGAMSIVSNQSNVVNDAESMASFFGNVCAPRVSSNGPVNTADGMGALWDELCTSCKGGCTDQSTYYDYDGAMQCLMEGAGDVAFVKHTSPADYAKDGTTPGTWSSLSKSDMALVCGKGIAGCKDLDEFESCNLGRVPSHAVVIRPGWASAALLQAALTKASAQPAFVSAVFDKANNPNDYVFKSGTKKLVNVTVTPEQFMGADAIAALKGYESLQSVARICTVGADEMDFCQNQVLPVLNGAGLKVSFACVMKATAAECMQAIVNGTADWRAFDGGDIYEAHIDEGMRVVVAESYNSGSGEGVEYFSVAVVNKEMCSDDTTLASLQGKSSCHTGYRRSAGWVYPVGALADSGVMPILHSESGVENDAESVASFFNNVCAARVADNGPANSADGRGSLWAPLCGACNDSCTESDAYYDYDGAFRCLMEGKGDVAFVKHSTPMEFSQDGTTPAPWATKNRDAFRLVCGKSGQSLVSGCRTIEEYKDCNLASVPAHAVLVRSGWEQAVALQQALTAASQLTAFRDVVFSSQNNPNNYVFSNNAVALVAIDEATPQYLGSAMDAFQGLEMMAYADNVATPPPSGDSAGLSAGAVAGIAIGCAVAGMVIGAVAMRLIRKRGDKKLDAFAGGMNGMKGDVV